jgi:RHS repeat-associated protein
VPSGTATAEDDGTTGYVHAGDRVLEQVGSGGTARYLLGDALGSVRGSSDADGALAGSADYEAFGAVRGANTTGSVFGYTGEPMDAETGLVYLRAQYHDPRTGRFLSRDTVQPNAPGTQGYHVYACAANNPTTWADPSGHTAGVLPVQFVMSPVTVAVTAAFAGTAVAALVGVGWLAHQGLVTACAHDPACGARLARAAILVIALSLPIFRPLVQAFPIILFVVLTMAGVEVIDAIHDCVKRGGCVPQRCQFPGSPTLPLLPTRTRRLEEHIVPNHGLTSDWRIELNRGGTLDGKFKTGKPNEIWQLIQRAVGLGYLQGKTWRLQGGLQPDGRSSCIMENVNVFTQVGWDNPLGAFGEPTTCMNIIIYNRRHGPINTAYPVTCSS